MLSCRLSNAAQVRRQLLPTSGNGHCQRVLEPDGATVPNFPFITGRQLSGGAGECVRTTSERISRKAVRLRRPIVQNRDKRRNAVEFSDLHLVAGVQC
jgi:hypothetical protein